MKNSPPGLEGITNMTKDTCLAEHCIICLGEFQNKVISDEMTKDIHFSKVK